MLVTLAIASQSSIAQEKPYKEGTVWQISFIKVKPGMFDVYMRDLAVQRKKLMDEAKKQGLIVSERMFSGSAAGRDDWDLMLIVEYKNWAAFDASLPEMTLGPREATSDKAGAPMRDDDYLTLSTIHSAKGQEWKVVHILSVVDGRIPSDMATGRPTKSRRNGVSCTWR